MNKKGFTLVELLAVIAILAILVIIALPAVLRMFTQARIDTFENEVKTIYRTAQQNYLLDNMSNPGGKIAYTNSEETIEEVDTVKELNITGNSSLKYYILMSNEGKVLTIRVTNGTYSYSKSGEDIKIEDIDLQNNNEVELESDITDTLVQSEEPYPDPTDVLCFTYTISNNKVSITDYDDSCTKDVVIPQTIEDKPVTAINNSAFQDNQLTSVKIPSSVTTIGSFAFSDNQLTSVKIPNGVIIIGNSTFSNNQLISVKIPSSVTNINHYAFQNNQLTSVVIPSGVTTIGNHAFQNNQLTSVVIPSGVTAIGSSAFRDNQLTSVVIPNGVTTIEVDAFRNNQLTSVVIPNGVAAIGSSAFRDNQLTSVVIPNGVAAIGGFAFRDNQLSTITIPSSVTTIGGYAFSHNQLTSITIPNSVTTIGTQAFVSNQLTSVVIPSNVTSIGDGVFLGNSLVGVIMEGKTSSSDFEVYGSNIWSWKSGINNLCTKDNTSNVTNGCILWEGSDQLVSDDFVYTVSGNNATITRYLGNDNNLVIPSTLNGKTVTAIGNNAFREFGIISLTIPNTVTSIGTYAFYQNSISSLTLSSGLQTIGDDAFHDNLLTTIEFPNGLVSIGARAFRLNDFSTTLTIPSSVQKLGQYAFGRRNALRSVTIKGKSSSSEFSVYDSPFDWATDVTCVKNNTSNVENGCITWGAS